MPAPPSLCFARLAIRFAPLAPALGAAGSPRRCAHTEVAPERSRERGGRRKAVVERDREDALVPMVDEHDRGTLKPEPLNECEKRLVGDRPEDAMEMKRREGGDLGEPLEREVLAKVSRTWSMTLLTRFSYSRRLKSTAAYDTPSPRRATASYIGSQGLRTDI